ncbi:MAG TPA: flagellar hook-basal body complex protein FliE [Desulfotomaculum sp.]|nr:flagellar hook-basal body complex protein FliE [Desulfotomaculum sp.]
MEVTRAGLSMLLPEAKAGQDSTAAFGEVLNRMVNEVNAAQVRANEAVKGFLTGEVQDLHEVIIAGEEARLMLELTVQVRNKLVEAYQEISRMQI